MELPIGRLYTVTSHPQNRTSNFPKSLLRPGASHAYEIFDSRIMKFAPSQASASSNGRF
jgi:hypothetical protein